MKQRLFLFCLLLVSLLLLGAAAEEPDDREIYTLLNENGEKLTSRLGKIHEGDEYISGDNSLYLVTKVDDNAKTAVAAYMGQEPQDAQSAFSALAEDAKSGKKLICMYSTHSDESYIPGDGESSLMENAGIYDVGNALKKHLENEGIEVRYSQETFHPHDAGAYRRSRPVAADYAEKRPDALIDIHRDGIPADEYETTVNGNETSMVRLFVGKSNANSGENRAFAKKLKAVADEKYPGLVKDIFIGKGNYNQDLYPSAILLEFGTHEIEKELAVDSTKYMANVLNETLYGESADAENTKAGVSREAGRGSAWLIGLAIAGAVIFALFATGSFRGAGKKLAGGFSEMTGGAFSKKKRGKDG